MEMTRENAATISIAQSAFDDGAADALYDLLKGVVVDVHSASSGDLLEAGLVFEGVVEWDDKYWFDMHMHGNPTAKRLYPMFSANPIELRYS